MKITILSILSLTAVATSGAAQELAELTALDGLPKEAFGNSVAISNGTIVVGMYRDFISPDAERGSAYVFVGAGASWTQQAKLTAADGRKFDVLGSSVALSADTAAVGAPGDDLVDGSNADEGSLYVFVRSGTTWSQQAKLSAGDGGAGDFFGSACAIDGNTIAVSAPLDDDLGSNSGSVYVFARTGSVWTQQAKLVASDGAADDRFGCAISLDGDTLAVGSLRDDDGALNAGSAYVFVRSGTAWSQQGKVGAADPATGDAFGCSVAVKGTTLVVGAFQKDQQGIDSGAVYVFTRTASVWSQMAKLVPSDASTFDNFGYSLAYSAGAILIGASQDNVVGPASGSAYAFIGSGSSWTQIDKLGPAEAAARDMFGNSVALHGTTAVVGSVLDDDAGLNSGSAHVFGISATGLPFCAGDGSLVTACPCANVGQAGRGCENSALTGGARLLATGTTTPDTVVLTSSGELSSVLSVFLQGDATDSFGLVFGDGVRCVAGNLKRLYTTNATGGIASAPSGADPSITVRSANLGDTILPGSTRWYQVYYRDPNPVFCPSPPGNSYNISSGLSIVW